MKKAIAFASALLVAGVGVAQAQQVTGNTTSNNQVASTSTATGQNAQSITFNSPGDTNTTLHTTPTVYVPSPANSLAQANCMVIPTVGASVINFGFAASVPVDGQHCDWRQNTAMALNTFANYRAFMTTPGLSDRGKKVSELMADKMLQTAIDMQCLNSDRQRQIMERMGMCQDVQDMATLDHRFGQPRNYQVDYANQ